MLGSGGFKIDIQWGGGGVMSKKGSPNFRFPEVGISVFIISLLLQIFLTALYAQSVCQLEPTSLDIQQYLIVGKDVLNMSGPSCSKLG